MIRLTSSLKTGEGYMNTDYRIATNVRVLGLLRLIESEAFNYILFTN